MPVKSDRVRDRARIRLRYRAPGYGFRRLLIAAGILFSPDA
jgi:hypothetical protein